MAALGSPTKGKRGTPIGIGYRTYSRVEIYGICIVRQFERKDGINPNTMGEERRHVCVREVENNLCGGIYQV